MRPSLRLCCVGLLPVHDRHFALLRHQGVPLESGDVEHFLRSGVGEALVILYSLLFWMAGRDVLERIGLMSYCETVNDFGHFLLA